jgi:vancomycin resistance protein VanW
MNNSQSIEKPKNRGWFRKKLGREYFIFKRILHWKTTGKQWAKIDNSLNFKNEVTNHK